MVLGDPVVPSPPSHCAVLSLSSLTRLTREGNLLGHIFLFPLVRGEVALSPRSQVNAFGTFVGGKTTVEIKYNYASKNSFGVVGFGPTPDRAQDLLCLVLCMRGTHLVVLGAPYTGLGLKTGVNCR